MGKRTGADAVQENAIGHNKPTPDIQASYVQRAVGILNEMAALNDDLKELLRDGKDAGLLKTAIRQAAKDIRMSNDARAALKEIEDAKKQYLKACKDLGLFDKMQAA